MWTSQACDLPQEKAAFKPRLSTRPLTNENASSKTALVCFCKSKSVYLLPTGKVSTPLCLPHRARASVRSSLSSTLRRSFGHVRERRPQCQTTPGIGLRSVRQEPKHRRTQTQEMVVWRSGGGVARSVLNHFQRTERLAAFSYTHGVS